MYGLPIGGLGHSGGFGHSPFFGGGLFPGFVAGALLSPGYGYPYYSYNTY
ncbi:hypothetical protein IGI01_21370 [Bacillus thuringiensis]|nr:hypothetical protein [Bacillus thuringiensis]